MKQTVLEDWFRRSRNLSLRKHKLVIPRLPQKQRRLDGFVSFVASSPDGRCRRQAPVGPPFGEEGFWRALRNLLPGSLISLVVEFWGKVQFIQVMLGTSLYVFSPLEKRAASWRRIDLGECLSSLPDWSVKCNPDPEKPEVGEDRKAKGVIHGPRGDRTMIITTKGVYWLEARRKSASLLALWKPAASASASGESRFSVIREVFPENAIFGLRPDLESFPVFLPGVFFPGKLEFSILDEVPQVAVAVAPGMEEERIDEKDEKGQTNENEWKEWKEMMLQKGWPFLSPTFVQDNACSDVAAVHEFGWTYDRKAGRLYVVGGCESGQRNRENEDDFQVSYETHCAWNTTRSCTMYTRNDCGGWKCELLPGLNESRRGAKCLLLNGVLYAFGGLGIDDVDVEESMNPLGFSSLHLAERHGWDEHVIPDVLPREFSLALQAFRTDLNAKWLFPIPRSCFKPTHHWQDRTGCWDPFRVGYGGDSGDDGEDEERIDLFVRTENVNIKRKRKRKIKKSSASSDSADSDSDPDSEAEAECDTAKPETRGEAAHREFRRKSERRRREQRSLSPKSREDDKADCLISHLSSIEYAFPVSQDAIWVAFAHQDSALYIPSSNEWVFLPKFPGYFCETHWAASSWDEDQEESSKSTQVS